MVYNREEAARRAEASKVNTPTYCQRWTRKQFGVPSVGDFDGDGRADAEDGWKSEPLKYRHPGDRRPPRGVPVSYGGGRKDDGHRAVSLGNGMIRSTDAGGLGRVATVPLDWPERHWGLHYLGWSDSCDGVLIPKPPAPAPTLIQLFRESGPPRYDVKLLDRAVKNGRVGRVKDARDEITKQIHRLRNVPGHSPRIQKVLKTYADHHVIRMGALNNAIKAGRTGIVKDVRARIMREIHNLPTR